MQAAALEALGDAQLHAGHPTDAVGSWRHALSILSDLQHPGTGAILTKLHQHVPSRRADLRSE